MSLQAILASALAALTVLVRLLLTRRMDFCGTPDACYYLGMAESLSSGQGFHARFLFDLQQAHLSLPNTGIEYWRPGISLILYILRFAGGVSLHSSIVLTTLVGVVFSAAAWHVGMRLTGNRNIALGAFAFCLLSSSLWIGSASPDSGLYYGAAAAWFLALLTVRWQGVLADVLALVCVSLTYLIRNDGALLLLPLLAVLWCRHQATSRTRDTRGRSPWYLAALLAGFFVALAPMHLLYHHVLGTAFPSGTAAVFFLDDLSDFGRYGDPVNLHSLLAHGLGHLLRMRIVTLFTVVYRVTVLMIGYPALVFLPALFLRETPHEQTSRTGPGFPIDETLGAVVFGCATLLLYSLVLPAVGVFSALRTALALFPLVSVLVMVAIHRVARTPRIALWTTGAVVAASGLAGLMDARRELQGANALGAADRTVAQGVTALGGDPARAIVVTNDPVQFSVTSGFSTVALPGNGPEAIAHIAQDFHATHVLLDADSPPQVLQRVVDLLHPTRVLALEREHTLILQLPLSVPPR